MTPARSLTSPAALCSTIVLLLGSMISAAAAQEPDDTAAMLIRQRVRAAATPGERHQALEHFIGDWNVELALVRPGASEQRASGRATYEWLIPGRWIGLHLTDELMGEEHESFAIIGYDNYAKSYILAGVSSFDTALNVSRGPAVDPEGGVIVTYGRQDDYSTGTLHKPYKIVTRIIDDDHHVVETWDLGMTPEGAKVLEYRYTRRPN